MWAKQKKAWRHCVSATSSDPRYWLLHYRIFGCDIQVLSQSSTVLFIVSFFAIVDSVQFFEICRPLHHEIRMRPPQVAPSYPRAALNRTGHSSKSRNSDTSQMPITTISPAIPQAPRSTHMP